MTQHNADGRHPKPRRPPRDGDAAGASSLRSIARDYFFMPSFFIPSCFPMPSFFILSFDM